MSLIRKIGFEKYPKITFDGAWGTILAVSNFHRIEIFYDTYFEVSIKESTRIGRAKKEPIEIVNLNLDSPFPAEIKKFWTLSVSKECLQKLLRNYFLMKGKEKAKNQNGDCNAQKLINDEI